MAYRNYRTRKPQRRSIVVKYAGECACCGAMINPGEMADYFPVGTLANHTTPAIAHSGGLDGNSPKCTANISQRAVNDYAGDGLDQRIEDASAEICGR